MTDSEHGDLGRWLADDPFVLNTVFLVAASSLAIALTSCLWHHIYSDPDDAHAICRISALSSSTQQPSLALPPPSPTEQTDRKSTRSKERRRRGKDPFRDLLKGGKKSKALLKAIKTAEDDEPPPSADALSNGGVPGNDSQSSSSRSPSPEPTGDLLGLERLAPRLGAESDDGRSLKDTTPDTTCTSPVASSGNMSDHSGSGVRARVGGVRPHSCPPGSMTAADTEVNISSASTVMEDRSSPPVSAVCAGIRTPQPRDSQTASVSGSCAKFVRARTRIRASKMDASVVPCAPLSMATSTSPSPPDLDARVQTQLASMRTALEAARLQEAQLRVEAEQASKERDELCWRWNEDAGVWRRREAELQAHIHSLVQQLQAYVAVASLPSSGFSSPTSPRLQHPHVLAPFPLPPAVQAQHSASAPAHVHALLSPVHPGAGLGMSPLLWSGMGLCVPNRDPRHGRRTPDSSASGSSPRGRRRRRPADDVKSASDESSMGDWDGSEDEGTFRNNPLADAILKRPESIRGLSATARKPALKDPDTPATQ